MANEVALKILGREGLVTPTQIAEVYESLGRDDHVLSKLAQMGVDPRAMAEALSRNLSIPLVELVQPARDHKATIERHFAGVPILWKNRVLPLDGGPEGTILLGMADPTDADILQDLQFALGMKIEPRVVSVRDVEKYVSAPSEVSALIEQFDPMRASLVEMTDYILLRVVKSGEPTSIVAGAEHPDDYPPPFDTRRLQNPTLRGIIRRLRYMTESTDEEVGGVEIQIENGPSALLRVEFSRDDECATVFLDKID